MTDLMTHLPRYVPAQREAAREAMERRARMTLPQTLSPSHVSAPPPPAGRLHLRLGGRSEPPKVYEVQRAVCAYLGTRLEDMVGTSMRAEHVRPRQLAMYLAMRLTGRSECEIARRFCRDNTTLRYGCRKIEAALRNDPLYVRAVRELTEMLT